MANQTSTPGGDISSDDKLWALLSYIITLIIPLIILLSEDKKSRPFMKFHAVQSLGLSVAMWVLMILGTVTIGITSCLGLAVWIYGIYIGIKAYGGETVEVPWLTNFMRGQNWL
jgi:uncharacterized membrane protein